MLLVLLLTLSSNSNENSIIRIDKELMKQQVIINNKVIQNNQLHTLLLAVIKHESNGNNSIVGDNGKSVGILQIQKCVIDDVNRIRHKYNKYTYTDRYDINKSIQIFYDYQSIYNKELDIEKAARIWNGGPNGMSKSKTNKYWLSVKSHLNNNKILKTIASKINLTEDHDHLKFALNHDQNNQINANSSN